MLLHNVFAWLLGGPETAGPGVAAEDVVWSAPPGCPDREELLAGISRRRGRALVPGQVQVNARVTAIAGHQHRLEIDLAAGGRHESRTLSADTCASLVEAAALLVVLVVDGPASPDPSAEASEPSTDDAAPVEPEPSQAGPAPAATDAALPPLTQVTGEPSPAALAGTRRPAAPRRTGGFLRVHGGAEVGALPGPTGGVGLGGGLLWRHFRLEIQATFVAPRTTRGAQSEVRAFLGAASMLGCARLGQGALEFSPCVGLEPGVMRGAAEDTGAARPGRWLAVVVTAGAAWRVRPRVAVWGSLMGVAAALRPSFQLGDPGPVVVLFEPPVASIRLFLGVELRFGDPL